MKIKLLIYKKINKKYNILKSNFIKFIFEDIKKSIFFKTASNRCP